jgi:hypothetical protein
MSLSDDALAAPLCAAAVTCLERRNEPGHSCPVCGFDADRLGRLVDWFWARPCAAEEAQSFYELSDRVALRRVRIAAVNYSSKPVERSTSK